MWIAGYDRNSISEVVDHSNFGVECATITLSSTVSLPKSFCTLFEFASLACAASMAFGRNGELMLETPNFLSQCHATFSAGFAQPRTITNFLPDHASFVKTDNGTSLILESSWHSEVFYSNWVRNDRTTDWKWRVKPEWSVEVIVPQPVNHCYHRFHYQYFHWFFDVMPRIWLLKTRSPYADSSRWLVGPLTQPFHAPSLALYDISPSQCIWPQLNPPSVGANPGCVVQYDEAVRPEFTFQEPLKTRPVYNNGIHHKGWSIGFVEDIRDRAHKRYGIQNGPPNGRIYVHRQPFGHRSLRNEEEALLFFRGLGFRVVDPGALSFEEQVRIFSDARVVVGIHGAGMTNILWCKPGAFVLELLPEKLDDGGYRFLSNIAGHQHAVLQCQQFEHPQGIAYADIAVDVDGMRRALLEFAGIV